jgi:hypothetical protein
MYLIAYSMIPGEGFCCHQMINKSVSQSEDLFSDIKRNTKKVAELNDEYRSVHAVDGSFVMIDLVRNQDQLKISSWFFPANLY